jgi:hypothetical protein
MDYVFDPQRIARMGEALATAYQEAAPFPHMVIDEFLRPDHAQQLSQAFPGPDDAIGWDSYGDPGYEMKLGCGREELFPAPLRRAFHELNSGPFVRFLERLTGIGHLVPDPHLEGGGLHLSRRGDHLGIHADFNWHEGLQAHRRLNLLVYLTPDWRPEYGGELELWDTQATRMQLRVAPLFNRAVIFSTRSDTFHGHPNPWAAPGGINRQSIALCYYTANRPENEIRAAHSTLYKGLDV